MTMATLLDPNCLTVWSYSWKNLVLKKISGQQKNMQKPRGQESIWYESLLVFLIDPYITLSFLFVIMSYETFHT